MRKAVDTIIGVAIGFIVTFALNATVSYFSQPEAVVTTGAVSVGSQWYALVEVENYSARTIDGLRVLLPAAVGTANISAAPPVRVSAVPGMTAGGLSRVEISSIDPRAITRILFPVASRGEAAAVLLVNAAEKNVAIRTSAEIETRFKNAITYAIQTALLYALISGIASWLFGKWLDRKYEQLAEHRAAVVRAEQRIEKLEAEIERVRRESNSTSARVKVLLIARLSDLAKELSFWRRTVRDLLLQNGGDKRDVRELTDTISRSLNTFWASRGEYEAELDALKIAAALVNKAE